MRETLGLVPGVDGGQPITQFLARGDRVRIEMKGASGECLFGSIEQEVR